MVTIGWSDFALKQHTPNSGNSFSTLKPAKVAKIARSHWILRKPGYGETGLDRKIVIPIVVEEGGPWNSCFFSPFVDLSPDLPVHAKITQRREGEDYYVETFVSAAECAARGIQLTRRPVKKVDVVLYAADVLTENGEKRSTTCDWEIVCLLVSEHDNEPMQPLAMARNYLAKPGGSFTDYSAKDFAEAIYYHATHRGIKVME